MRVECHDAIYIAETISLRTNCISTLNSYLSTLYYSIVLSGVKLKVIFPCRRGAFVLRDRR